MKPKLKKKKTAKTLFWVFFLVLVLAVAKIIVANVLATTGSQLGTLEGRIVALKAENQTLEEELVELSSLSRIVRKAEALGFKKANLVVFLKEEVPVALR